MSTEKSRMGIVMLHIWGVEAVVSDDIERYKCNGLKTRREIS